ncbi:MAG TPA: ADP-ribosylglycohydrolase family protein, partial [Erysipelotrichaceae bacterium]|nr:ADP-ribosylglycohydrolase family protein [Erysipelotrichaceae bacterium]
EQIKERFGGFVMDFIAPPDDVFARGFKRGSVTDDFSLAYYTAMAIINHKGIINNTTAHAALINWSKTPYYRLAGPTTCLAINRIMGKEEPYSNSFKPTYDNLRGSNGGAMKIAPVGLASGGDVAKAIEDALTICKPTHNNSTALSGACAVAAAVAQALNEEATVDSMIEAGLKGALEGEKHGLQLANPSVYKRIILAVNIGRRCQDDIVKAMKELSDIIGCGLSAAEAVPTAFGLLAASAGDVEKAVIAAVNIGNDTDTIATIVGAMTGTLNGYYNKRQLDLINQVNKFDLEYIADKLTNLYE